MVSSGTKSRITCLSRIGLIAKGTNKTCNRINFSVARLFEWNRLQLYVRQQDSLKYSKKELKTFVFKYLPQCAGFINLATLLNVVYKCTCLLTCILFHLLYSTFTTVKRTQYAYIVCTLCSMGNQCRFFKTRVILENLVVFDTIQAAQFWAHYNLCRLKLDRLLKRELQ